MIVHTDVKEAPLPFRPETPHREVTPRMVFKLRRLVSPAERFRLVFCELVQRRLLLHVSEDGPKEGDKEVAELVVSSVEWSSSMRPPSAVRSHNTFAIYLLTIIFILN